MLPEFPVVTDVVFTMPDPALCDADGAAAAACVPAVTVFAVTDVPAVPHPFNPAATERAIAIAKIPDIDFFILLKPRF